MDQTDCLGLPYPECEPPLTKDASDIVQFKNLAEAVDAAVTELEAQIEDTLTQPDAAQLEGGAATAGQDVVMPWNSAVFDTAGMADIPSQGLRMQKDAWYMFGGHIQVTSGAGNIFTRVEPLVNGDPFSARQGFGLIVVSEDCAWVDVAFLREGDLLQVMTHHVGSAALVVNYTATLWCLEVLSNV